MNHRKWMRYTAILLCLGLSMTGCSEKQPETEVMSESQTTSEAASEQDTITTSDTTAPQTTTTLPETTTMSTTETAPDPAAWTDAYDRYFRDALVPQYGVYDVNADVRIYPYEGEQNSTTANSALRMPTGIIGVKTADFNRDGLPEMLVAYVAEFSTNSETGKKVMLQLYSMDAQNAVILKDEQDVYHFWDYGLERAYDKIMLSDAADGSRYITVFKKQRLNAFTKQIGVIRVTEDLTFSLCELFTDPGYTSGIGLYYSNSIPISRMAVSTYSNCEKTLFEADYADGGTPDFNGYFQPMEDTLSSYGVSVNRNEWADFTLSGANEETLYTLTLECDFDASPITTTVRVTGALPSDLAPTAVPNIVSAPVAEVTPCDRSGEICGANVTGYTTSYVCENEEVRTVRDDLGDKWHVTAVRTCQSRGVTWYELYDTDDGDYYGWVDEAYITFFNETPPQSDGNWSGRYGDQNITVEVQYQSDSEGTIFVSFINGNGTRVSEATYTGTISEKLSFRVNDGWTLNDYTIEFQDNALHLQAKSTGDSGNTYSPMWAIPDLDEFLGKQ